ncbi:MAG TPA: hypothetical protein VLH94_01580, partial [Spirochaetia bacterium]|nr:hypothetical protein [Spirochaetia bacterium]
SLITARLANSFQKPLMAVPGLVTSKVAEGTNNLIKNGKAAMVTSAQDVLQVMGLVPGQLEMGFEPMLSKNPILLALESGEKSVDELVRVLKVPVERVMEEILSLQLDGLIEEKTCKYFVAK